MVAWMLLVIVLVLLVYGLERNHRRQRRNVTRGGTDPIGRMVGCTDVVDRDLQRLAADLRALDPAGRPPERLAGRRRESSMTA
jgi:hypothetical protein